MSDVKWRGQDINRFVPSIRFFFSIGIGIRIPVTHGCMQVQGILLVLYTHYTRLSVDGVCFKSIRLIYPISPFLAVCCRSHKMHIDIDLSVSDSSIWTPPQIALYCARYGSWQGQTGDNIVCVCLWHSTIANAIRFCMSNCEWVVEPQHYQWLCVLFQFALRKSLIACFSSLCSTRHLLLEPNLCVNFSTLCSRSN